jgi:hypothetical protein
MYVCNNVIYGRCLTWLAIELLIIILILSKIAMY